MPNYRAYRDLDPRGRPRNLYIWLLRYHQQHGGRRASRSEMRQAAGLHRDQLGAVLATLEGAGLFEIERNAQGKARSYTLPNERWSHPDLAQLEMDKAFYPGTLVDLAL